MTRRRRFQLRFTDDRSYYDMYGRRRVHPVKCAVVIAVLGVVYVVMSYILS